MVARTDVMTGESKRGHRVDAVLLEGARMPPRLADLAEPPERLFLRGELPRGPAVAIVGTRRPSAEAAAFTRALAAELASAGVAVLSGGAEGIDTAAHEGALDVGGLTTVVAPAGFGRPFPEQNAELFRRVVEGGGGYLSLVPDEQPATRTVFFARNACLVALSHAVVVTQLPVRSGAANAAKWARELGRALFVVPHSPWVAQGRGALRELRLGAQPLDRAQDVLRHLTAAGLHGLPPARPEQLELAAWRGPSEGRPADSSTAAPVDPVVAAVQAGASHADEIAQVTGLSLAVVQQRILTLALSGVLVPGPLGSLKTRNALI
jgi:DNA processing protein